jgi:hypothetical protein
VDSNKTAKARVVETDPYADVYRIYIPTFYGITGSEPAASLLRGAEPVPNPIDPRL